MRAEEICTHYSEDPSRFAGAVTPPIFQSSLFTECEGNEGDREGRYAYTRVSNPTTEIVENKVAALEQGEASKCFSSGMGAISAAMMHYLKKDSHVVAVASIYGPAHRFLAEYMKRFGVEVTFVKGTDTEEIEGAIRENTDLIYLESPSTYLFLVQDLAKIAEVAKKHHAATVIDNTYCTPIFQKPLTFGIDMVVHSASKYLGGHSDIIGGVVIGRKEDIDQIAQSERELFGAVMSPFDSWLMLRGIRTLPVRMKQHMANAMEMAAYFQELPVVKEVIYPWWETHPQYELAKKQMTGASGLMSVVFDLPGEQIKRIVRELEFFHRGPSWGGFESLISPVGADLEQDNETMKKGLVRLHIGLEGADLLKEDFERAVKNVLG
ncbi:cystathionine beta-lyase/cystathionine gamma-synthase [Eisenbergiella tayi]|uniref:homocysteine desulfhydrase n=1 Tax=Eisenbergiella tayi TaxID=1432052 RepID=A0A1E3AZ57_9FIRM|nr:PLP-dependent aspartate aminotransferase family protein [Eisenbergiella tayi]ODM13929.1 Cystathionine gamma-lyase [Eisenbergiella tayi]OIZ66416.1 cystathionine beta-lyase/cystathionine gamma-synthase [Eisenbergiella tayi]